MLLTLTNKYVFISGAKRPELRALDAATSYKVEGARFSKAFQQGYWDGKEHLLSLNSKMGLIRAPIGLLEDIVGAVDLDDCEIVDERKVRNERRILQWNEGIKLRDYQLEAHYSLFRSSIKSMLFGCGLLKMPIRSGKALRSDQCVLTEHGWEQIGNLRVGQRVFGSDGMCHAITGVYPQGKKRLFKMSFDDNTSVVCSEDHLWTFRRQSGSSHKWVKETMSATEWLESSSFKSKNVLLDCVSPLDYEEKNLPIEPYTLGALLGDGSMLSTPGITVNNQDLDIIDRIKLLSGLFTSRESYSERRGCVHFTFPHKYGKENPLTHHLKKLGVWGLKSGQRFVPSEYFTASIEQRLKLLQGLMDTDGTPHRSNGSFSSTSIALADAVVELTRSLGGFARHSKPQPTACGSTEYTIFTWLPSVFKHFSTKRKLQKQSKYLAKKKLVEPYKRLVSFEPSGYGEATCIEVDSGDSLFLSQGYNLTHNTKTAGAIIKTLGLPTVMLVPSQMLLWQTVESLQECFPNEKIGVIGDSYSDTDRFITVATMQSLSLWKGGKSKKGKVRPKDPRYDLVTTRADVVIVDEAHHIRGESEWHKVVADFHARFRIALSATAYLDSEVEQGRGIIWLKGTIGPKRIDIDESRLIKAGYLMAQHVKMKRVNGPKKFKDWKWSMELQRLGIWNNVERNQMIVDAASESVARGARTIIVASKLEQTRHLQEMLYAAGVDHEAVTGKDSKFKRAEAVDEFVNGKLRCLVGTVLSEGIDIPSAEVVIVAGGGMDAKATMQRMRNMTVSEGKEKALLIDFYDAHNEYLEKHSKERLKVYRSIPEFIVEVDD